jgi:hypothetical protein
LLEQIKRDDAERDRNRSFAERYRPVRDTDDDRDRDDDYDRDR